MPIIVDSNVPFPGRGNLLGEIDGRRGDVDSKTSELAARWDIVLGHSPEA